MDKRVRIGFRLNHQLHRGWLVEIKDGTATVEYLKLTLTVPVSDLVITHKSPPKTVNAYGVVIQPYKWMKTPQGLVIQHGSSVSLVKDYQFVPRPKGGKRAGAGRKCR